jgi:hypothetical protein
VAEAGFKQHEFAPKGELWPLGECSPLCLPQKKEKQTDGLQPWVIKLPLGDKFHP